MVSFTLVHLLLLLTVALHVQGSPVSVAPDGSLSFLDSRINTFADASVYSFRHRSVDTYGQLVNRDLEDVQDPPAACHDTCFGGTSANIPTCQNNQESVACACSPEAITEFQRCFGCVQSLDPNSAYLDGPDGTKWSADQWAAALTESCADPIAMESQLASSIVASATESVLPLSTTLATLSALPVHALLVASASASASGTDPTGLPSISDVLTSVSATDPAGTLETTSTPSRPIAPSTPLAPTSSKSLIIVTATASVSLVAPATLSGLVRSTSVGAVPSVSSGAGVAHAEPSVNYIAGPSAKTSSGGALRAMSPFALSVWTALLTIGLVKLI